MVNVRNVLKGFPRGNPWQPLLHPKESRWRSRHAHKHHSDIVFSVWGWKAEAFVRGCLQLSTRSETVNAALLAYARLLGMSMAADVAPPVPGEGDAPAAAVGPVAADPAPGRRPHRDIVFTEHAWRALKFVRFQLRVRTRAQAVNAALIAYAKLYGMAVPDPEVPPLSAAALGEARAKTAPREVAPDTTRRRTPTAAAEAELATIRPLIDQICAHVVSGETMVGIIKALQIPMTPPQLRYRILSDPDLLARFNEARFAYTVVGVDDPTETKLRQRVLEDPGFRSRLRELGGAGSVAQIERAAARSVQQQVTGAK